MKVCMVVFNSVSHDARVLKEAESVKELGHDVVIIGIQDANNRRPLDTLDNGVIIRRAAWNSAAARPVAWFYLLCTLLVAAGCWGAFLLVDFTARNRWWQSLPSMVPPLGWRQALLAALAVVALVSATRLYRGYSRKARIFRIALKREDDDYLKFEPEFSRYQAKAKTRPPTTVDATPSTATEPRQLGSWFERALPRPLMAGPRALASGAWVRRWKTVWAREARVRELLDSESPRIVHAHDVTSLAVCAEFRRDSGCRLIFDAHEVYDHLAQSEEDLAEVNAKVMRKYADRVDALITINDSIGAYYRSHYRGLPRATIVKNAAPRTDAFEYDGRLHEAARLPREQRILIYQGGYAPKRGLLQLLLAAEYLDTSWALVFMGWGRLEPELRRTADAMCTRVTSLGDRVRFIPKVPHRELPYWTAGATLGAIPYENVGLNHWFCTPNKLWEYPNAGVPIIASPFPELRRIIEPNGIGWFLPDPLTPREIGRAINALTPEMLASARVSCADFIKRDNWSVYRERLQHAYRELS